ncbi:MAG: c-type cytochrome [Cyanobacteria bacterium NC_groundwater_1444_Ag_S-0.65um_54_12]|nr:c-type cytochrome [Cyanobacteria bacterium NC_groundwater_1444_Ag_S-0.65um_54_12]
MKPIARRYSISSRLVLLAGLTGCLLACQGQMREQISFRAQESPLPVPADQVAMSDEEVNLDYTPGEQGGPPNPLRPDARSLAVGKAAYRVQCIPCHGLQGKGHSPGEPDDGSVGALLLLPPPSIATGRFAAMSDGQLYLRIVKGGAAGGQFMPPFAKKLSTFERWAIVNYLKAEISK